MLRSSISVIIWNAHIYVKQALHTRLLFAQQFILQTKILTFKSCPLIYTDDSFLLLSISYWSTTDILWKSRSAIHNLLHVVTNIIMVNVVTLHIVSQSYPNVLQIKINPWDNKYFLLTTCCPPHEIRFTFQRWRSLLPCVSLAAIYNTATTKLPCDKI